MKVSIEYCVVWNYHPKAFSLKAEIEKQVPGTEVQLIEGSNGVFEVEKDNVLIFSKRELGRFPEHSEVIEQLL